MPLRVRHEQHELALISTKTIIGGQADVTVAELSIESSFPADLQTASALRSFAGAAA